MEEYVENRRLMEEYRKKVEPLFRFLPWLEQKQGTDVSKFYENEELSQSSMLFPVYDGKLLDFVRQVQRAGLTDKNYVYIYSRYRISGVKDEIKFIQNATIRDVDILIGILSKYVCEGMVRGKMWTDAVEYGIFLNILKKFKEFFRKWCKK